MPPHRVPYGAAPDQYAELYLPSGTPQPGLVVVIHGGFWRSRYDASLGRPLAADLAARGYVAYNVEYRRVGTGGGWPGTFDDVAAAIDALAGLDVDTSRVVTVGHSAGGQLAVWAAGRRDPAVPVCAAVAQAGVLDLRTAALTGVGGQAVPDLLGGMPDQVAERYAATDPITMAPIQARVLCVHATADDVVPIAQSEAYVATAQAAGGRAELIAAAGDHFTLIDPSSPDWALVCDALRGLISR